ncbi:MAG: hypothetical protein OXE52_05685 [Chloroflexi bacterium]|nr:hypothetical protein [Chloroflexota bacterium]
MATGNLAQHVADGLFAMEKHRADEREYRFSVPGQKLFIELASEDGREKFYLDLYRGKRNVFKVSLQNRARQTFSLRRLDVNGRKHTNPNGQVVPTPHLHVYREGFGTSWAEPAPLDIFSNLNDVWTTLQDFMRYCNISKPPIIRRDLFT